MLQRIKIEDVQAMIEAGKEETPVSQALNNQATNNQSSTTTWNDSDEPLKAEPLAEMCTIDDFVKVDLRVARVLNAEHVPEAKKLLKLTLGLAEAKFAPSSPESKRPMNRKN